MPLSVLAIGWSEQYPVLTSYRMWQRLDFAGIEIRCIR